MALSPNDRSIAGFTMAGHALVHWFEASIPIFLAVWIVELDPPVTLWGFVVALGYAPFGLGALPAGVLADRFGPRRLVLCCLAGMSVSFLLVAVAGYLESIAAIAVGLACWGAAASVYHPAGLSLISTGVEERGSVFAYHGIAGNVGIALGPFVAATLLIGLEWPVVAAALAAPGLVAVAYGLGADFDPAAATTEEGATAPRALSARELLANSRVLFASGFAVVFALVTFEGLYYRGTLTYLPDILRGLPAMDAISIDAGLQGIEPGDYVYVGLLVVGMAGQYAGGKLTDRIRVEVGLAVAFVLLAALALAFVPVAGLGLGPLLAICGLLGFLLFAIQPFYQEAVARYTPPATRGLSYGYTYLGEFGLGAASIVLGGAVLESSTTVRFFAMLAAFALVGSLLAAVLFVGFGRRAPLEAAPASDGE